MLSKIAALAALAATAVALPMVGTNGTSPDSTQASSPVVVGYWGNGSGKNLKQYCVSGSGYDIIVMSFLSQYGNGKAPSGGFNEQSQYCTINSDGSGSCPTLASDISYCQSQGKKILISLGGGGAPGTLNSQADAEGVAYTLWNSYGSSSHRSPGDNSPRPFGNVAVDGFDLDIETTSGEPYYQYLIAKLRNTYFPMDTSKQYYISGAPQCVLPEANMGQIINNAQFDYLWVQFYNNYQNCDASNYVYGPQAQGASFNYDSWVSYLNGTPNKSTKLVVGLPASQSAAAKQSWIDPKDLPKLYNYVKGKSLFSGIMFWEASESDKYSSNGCNFAQEVKHIFNTGTTC